MRRLLGLAAVAVLLFGALSCNTTQPAGAGPQTFSVQVQANAAVRIFDIFEEWEDTSVPLDGTPDTFTGQHLCREVSLSNVTFPWYYSMSLSVIRKGQTTEEVIASTTNTSQPFANLTDFTEGFFFGNPPPEPPVPPIYYLNGRRDASGGTDYLTSCTTIPTPLDTPNVLGEHPTFDVVLDPGDTVIIRLRKQLEQDTHPALTDGIASEIRIAVFGSLEGRGVTLRGDPDTTGDGGGTTLSFTLR